MISKHMLRTLLILVLCLKTPLILRGQDNPDFEVRGFHIDLRIQVMTPEALKNFAKELADFGMNTLVMEWEGTYPFKNHPTISNKYSYTREEINDFIAYCDSLGIKVIPLQQSLGHVEYILRNPRYSHLKEDQKDISQLCPMEDEASKALFTELFADLAETHNSDYIHIGGDETYLLGHCPRCKEKSEKYGKSKLFVDHMKMISEIVIGLGKIPVMWADIILEHPEAAADLPAETIFVDWNYGWKISHFGDIPSLQKIGFTFWGSPSIRSHPDNWYVTKWPKHFQNQSDFIPYARQAGYKGMVMTSWSTSGVYGFTWDSGYDVLDMVQIRNNYPMSGFRILIASYAQALEQDTPIDGQSFALQYAKERFGLSHKDSQVLWKFLSADSELIANGKPEKSASIDEVKAKYDPIRKEINQIEPRRNQQEFEHFKLMADLRMHYLDFKAVEARYNSKDFSIAETSALIAKLDAILAEAQTLNKRFMEINKGFLYDAELEEQNNIRVQQVKVLYDRLAKAK